MTTYTTLSDVTLAQDKPFTQSVARAMRDNPLAIAEGDATAPRIDGVNAENVQTASASSSLIFTGLDSTYDLYEFEIIDLVCNTVGAILYLVYSTNGGSSWVAGSYRYTKTVNDSTIATDNASSQTQLKIGSGMGSGQAMHGTLRLFSPANTSLPKRVLWELFYGSNSGNYVHVVGGGETTDSTVTSGDVDAVKFFPSSGNFTSGKIVMRPRRKS